MRPSACEADVITTTPPAHECSQVASFSCFADLEFLSSARLSKISEKIRMS